MNPRNQKTKKPKDSKTRTPLARVFFRFWVFPFFGSTIGLTLVELMVATSILAIGIVMVARGFMVASTALASVENRIEAFQFLDAKMVELQQQAAQEGGVALGTQTGSTELHHRPATWKAEIVSVNLERSAVANAAATGSPEQTGLPAASSAAQAGTTPQEKEKPSVELAEVRLTVSWQEAHRKPDAMLVTYLRQQKTQEPKS